MRILCTNKLKFNNLPIYENYIQNLSNYSKIIYKACICMYMYGTIIQITQKKLLNFETKFIKTLYI